MKRFLITLILALFVPSLTFAEATVEDYENYLKEYNLGFFEEALSEDSYSLLEELGVNDFSINSISELTPEKVFNILKKLLVEKINSPLEGLVSIIVFICLSSFFQSLKSDESDLNDTFSSVSALVISTVLIVKISPVITICVSSLGIASNFMYAFIPVVAAILIASGGVTVSFATNTTLLAISGALSFIASRLFTPIINCFLAIGICSGLRHQLNLNRLIGTIKRFLIGAMSLLCSVYVSVVSIKTSVASSADRLGIRSARFAINTVVPVVGGALSEGLLSIQSYSSMIKSSVGAVGIIAVALVFLPSIIEIVLWQIGLRAALVISDIFDDKNISGVLTVFGDTVLLMNVTLIISMLTTVISIGILINAGSAV